MMGLTEDERILRGLLRFYLCTDGRKRSADAPLNLQYRDLILTAFDAVRDNAVAEAGFGLIPTNNSEREDAEMFGVDTCQLFSVPLSYLAIEDADGPSKECEGTPTADRTTDRPILQWQKPKNKFRGLRLLSAYSKAREAQESAAKNQQAQLLEQCTKTLQTILSKLQNTVLTAEHREKYEAMAHQMHQKMQSIRIPKKKTKRKKGKREREVYEQSVLNAFSNIPESRAATKHWQKGTRPRGKQTKKWRQWQRRVCRDKSLSKPQGFEKTWEENVRLMFTWVHRPPLF